MCTYFHTCIEGQFILVHCANINKRKMLREKKMKCERKTEIKTKNKMKRAVFTEEREKKMGQEYR